MSKSSAGVVVTVFLLALSAIVAFVAVDHGFRPTPQQVELQIRLEPLLFVLPTVALLIWHFTRPKRIALVWIGYQVFVLLLCIAFFLTWCAYQQKIGPPNIPVAW